MTRHFEIGFNDLDSEKKDELIEEVAKQLQEEWKAEAEEYRTKLTAKDDRTWQDLYCEIADLDYDLRDPDTKYDNWVFTVESHAEEEAEKILYEAFRHLEVEVEI